MRELIISKFSVKTTKTRSFSEYINCIEDLIHDDIIDSMNGFIQHGSVTCFDHSLSVSYYSYVVCRLLHMDYRSAARGGMLHDLFLYDWHKTKLIGGKHGFTHPYTALRNANEHFLLNKMEKDIIVKHMWPLTIFLPRYKEAYVVSFVDKYIALREIGKFLKIKVAEYRNASLSGI
jgi:uncharacterized protein